MPPLFIRNARLTVWRAESDKFFSQPSATNAIQINNLRMTFSSQSTLEKDPNACEIVVTNASADTRAFLERKPLSVRLEVGYAGEFTQLFVGDLRYGNSVQAGTEWNTTLQIADGARSYAISRVSESLRAGTRVIDVLQRCADALQLPLPKNIKDNTELHAQFAAGRTIHGPAHEALSKLLAPYNYKFTVQAGRLVILKNSETTNDSAYLVDAMNGLVGSPETGVPDKEGGAPSTTVRVLLDPRLQAGNKIKLVSTQKNGIFKIKKVSHEGDTHGGDFMTTMECVPA